MGPSFRSGVLTYLSFFLYLDYSYFNDIKCESKQSIVEFQHATTCKAEVDFTFNNETQNIEIGFRDNKNYINKNDSYYCIGPLWKSKLVSDLNSEQLIEMKLFRCSPPCRNKKPCIR